MYKALLNLTYMLCSVQCLTIICSIYQQTRKTKLVCLHSPWYFYCAGCFPLWFAKSLTDRERGSVEREREEPVNRNRQCWSYKEENETFICLWVLLSEHWTHYGDTHSIDSKTIGNNEGLPDPQFKAEIHVREKFSHCNPALFF